MLSSKVNTRGPYLNPDKQPDEQIIGTGWVIGDGVILTAGHIIFEYDRSTSNPRIVSGSNSVFLDFEAYHGRYTIEVNNLIANGKLFPTLFNQDIEARLITSDAVAISGGGNINKNNAGLAWFMSPADLVSATTILSAVTITRFGNKTGDVQGTVSTVNANGLFRFSPGSDEGDSGGAYIIGNTTTGKGFVFGTQSAQPGFGGVPDPSQPAYGAYLSGNDFRALVDALEGPQHGNVTESEPTNLIVGTNSDDGGSGTYRADIILGRDGSDVLDDGDQATDSVYADDQLFGGAGNDMLAAGKGNDLLHGGDSLDYSASGERHSLKHDGVDTVDYSAILKRGATGDGLKILLAVSGSSGTPSWNYGDTTDQPSAIYVVDQSATSATDYIGADTLVSIENIKGTGADDTVEITQLDSKQLAGADKTGGLYEIDLLGNSSQGDLVDIKLSSGAIQLCPSSEHSAQLAA